MRKTLIYISSLLCAVAAMAACPAGQGEGWVTGRLWIENCDSGEGLGDGLTRPADFDLHADFFAGET